MLPELRLRWSNILVNLSAVDSGASNIAELNSFIPSTDGKEKIVSNLRESLLSTNRSVLTTLGRMITAIKTLNSQQRGYPVYLEFRLNYNGLDDWYRSPVLDMAISHVEGALSYRLSAQEIQIQLDILREPYWENTNIYNLMGWNNVTGGARVNPITVNNLISSTGGDNRIILEPTFQTNFKGDLPTPYIIKLLNPNTNPASAANKYTKIYVGANVPPANGLTYWANNNLTAGGFTSRTGVGSLVADTGSSYGNYFKAMLTATWVELGYQSIDPSTAYGEYFKIFIRFADIPQNTSYLRFYLLDPSLTYVLWYSDIFNLSGGEEIQSFGAVRIPPSGFSTDQVRFAIYGMDTSGGAEVHIDAVYFISADYYREYIPLRATNYTSLDGQNYLSDDLTVDMGDLYVYDSVRGKKSPTYKAFGGSLLYIPNVTNSLSFLWEDANLQSDVGKQMQVTLQCRERITSLE